MMKFFFAFAILVFAPEPLRAQLVINFDTDLSGAPIAPGTVINSTYAARGVMLASESASALCGSPTAVYANSDKPLGSGSGANAVSSCPQGTASAISQNLFGTIHATFARPVIRVCVDVIPDGPADFAFMFSDELSSSGLSAPGVAQTLCTSGLPMSGVRFSGAGNRFVRFDNLAITFAASTSPGIDSNRNGKSDFGIYRNGSEFLVAPSTGLSTESIRNYIIGISSQAVPVPGRYVTIQQSDAADYGSGIWRYSCTSQCGPPNQCCTEGIGFGGLGFLPAQADYDGDGFTDIAVYSNGAWSIRRSSDGGNPVLAHGGTGWTPVPRDYDGDGKADIAVYIDGAWSILNSWDGSNTVFGHGGPSWDPVPADYDGDGKTDIAVYSAGAWSIIQSSDGTNIVIGHGGAGWIPVPADYDGDGKADVAVYQNGVWSVKRSSDGGFTTVMFGGGPSDVPVN